VRGDGDSFAPRLYDFPEADEIVARVQAVAEDRGVSMAQVALAWLLSREAVTAPIVGATKMAHLEDAIEAVDVELSDEEIARLEEPYPAREVRGHQ